MYACPKCGANLKFDIEAQKLKCSFCRELFPPEMITKEGDGESPEYDATIQICPQCGGEIECEDDAAAAFCSYCGASTILTSRMEKKKKPVWIIPFQKTKESCKDAYKKYMSTAVYAPKELKDARYIDEFRGIYMPFWKYKVVQDKELHLQGEKVEHLPEGRIRTTCRYTGEIHGEFPGIIHDASSSFDDTISDRIMPYRMKDSVAFTPSILSGFYADLPDIPPEVYQRDVCSFADCEADLKLKTSWKIIDNGVKIPGEDEYYRYGTKIESTEETLFPVWFMSYRKKDRVAYATINGQTGRIMADLPVDLKKFAIGTILTALPLFFLLNLLFTMKPDNILALTGFFTLLAFFIYTRELDEIYCKENHLDDKGFFYGNKLKRANPDIQYREKKPKKKLLEFLPKIPTFNLIFLVYLIIPCGGWTLLISLWVFFSDLVQAPGFFWVVTLLAGIFLAARSLGTWSQLSVRMYSGYLGAGLSVLISGLIVLVNPVHDFYYYGATVVNLLAVLILCLNIISYYNILSTRALPQFAAHKGGDDDAK